MYGSHEKGSAIIGITTEQVPSFMFDLAYSQWQDEKSVDWYCNNFYL